MEGIELVLLLAAAVAVAVLTAWFGRRLPHDTQVWTTVILGVVAGLIGLALVLVPDIDTVPDDVEGILLVIVVVGISLALGAGTVYRLTQR